MLKNAEICSGIPAKKNGRKKVAVDTKALS
jgi:hypothetical protein